MVEIIRARKRQQETETLADISALHNITQIFRREVISKNESFKANIEELTDDVHQLFIMEGNEETYIY